MKILMIGRIKDRLVHNLMQPQSLGTVEEAGLYLVMREGIPDVAQRQWDKDRRTALVTFVFGQLDKAIEEVKVA